MIMQIQYRGSLRTLYYFTNFTREGFLLFGTDSCDVKHKHQTNEPYHGVLRGNTTQFVVSMCVCVSFSQACPSQFYFNHQPTDQTSFHTSLHPTVMEVEVNSFFLGTHRSSC